MILLFELTMPNVGSWNGHWSEERDVHIITKTDKQISKKRILELDGKSFYYNFGDGWGVNIHCRIIDRSEAAKLRKCNKGFCGYDWMVRSIIHKNKIEYTGD